MCRLFLTLCLCLCVFLGACTQSAGLNLGFYPDPQASPEKFIHCHGYNCHRQMTIGLNTPQWRQIKKIFKKRSKTPAQERQKIAKAISKFETYAGQLTGTQDDLPKAPIKRKSFKELDCIDETINTTKYLNFLEQAELLNFHTVSSPVYKGFLINGVYPHNSAAIKEIKSEKIFVVDSYLGKNGDKPNIRSLENWLRYRAEDSPKEKS